MSELHKVSTYGELAAIDIDLRIIEQNHKGLAFLFAHKIKEFRTRYRVQLQVMNSKVRQLVETYAKHVLEDGKLVPVIKQNDKGLPEYHFETEELRDKFLSERRKIMEATIMISA